MRVATLDDLAFIDGLQKMHTKQVGFMPRQSLEAKLSAGHVLIAEESRTADSADHADKRSNPSVLSAISAVKSVGYCIGTDRYFKRDDCGIIYQLNVVPEVRRSLVGATLVKALFDRAAYGCKLFCCWCAQDIEANFFWESLGFVPLAFRTGSRAKGAKGSPRVHIFWQRRIRSGDTTTPWWFPSQTTGGSIREDRLVLPIPPGVHWRDPMPVILPELAAGERQLADQTRSNRNARSPIQKRPRRVQFGAPSQTTAKEPAVAKPTPQARERAARPKARMDRKYLAAARELRDRWMEEVNAGTYSLRSAGKYDLVKALVKPATDVNDRLRALPESRAA